MEKRKTKSLSKTSKERIKNSNWDVIKIPEDGVYIAIIDYTIWDKYVKEYTIIKTDMTWHYARNFAKCLNKLTGKS